MTMGVGYGLVAFGLGNNPLGKETMGHAVSMACGSGMRIVGKPSIDTVGGRAEWAWLGNG